MDIDNMDSSSIRVTDNFFFNFDFDYFQFNYLNYFWIIFFINLGVDQILYFDEHFYSFSQFIFFTFYFQEIFYFLFSQVQLTIHNLDFQNQVFYTFFTFLKFLIEFIKIHHHSLNNLYHISSLNLKSMNSIHLI